MAERLGRVKGRMTEAMDTEEGCEIRNDSSGGGKDAIDTESHEIGTCLEIGKDEQGRNGGVTPQRGVCIGRISRSMAIRMARGAEETILER